MDHTMTQLLSTQSAQGQTHGFNGLEVISGALLNSYRAWRWLEVGL